MAHMQDRRQNPASPETLGYAPKSGKQTGKMLFLICLLAGGLLATFVLTNRVGISRKRVVLANGCGVTAQNGPITTSLNLFKLATGHYPASLNDLCTQPAGELRWQGPYADPAMLVDAWGMPYQYRSPGGRGRAYDLWSFGPDKQNGTADDTSWARP